MARPKKITNLPLFTNETEDQKLDRLFSKEQQQILDKTPVKIVIDSFNDKPAFIQVGEIVRDVSLKTAQDAILFLNGSNTHVRSLLEKRTVVFSNLYYDPFSNVREIYNQTN